MCWKIHGALEVKHPSQEESGPKGKSQVQWTASSAACLSQNVEQASSTTSESQASQSQALFSDGKSLRAKQFSREKLSGKRDGGGEVQIGTPPLWGLPLAFSEFLVLWCFISPYGEEQCGQARGAGTMPLSWAHAPCVYGSQCCWPCELSAAQGPFCRAAAAPYPVSGGIWSLLKLARPSDRHTATWADGGQASHIRELWHTLRASPGIFLVTCHYQRASSLSLVNVIDFTQPNL